MFYDSMCLRSRVSTATWRTRVHLVKNTHRLRLLQEVIKNRCFTSQGAYGSGSRRWLNLKNPGAKYCTLIINWFSIDSQLNFMYGDSLKIRSTPKISPSRFFWSASKISPPPSHRMSKTHRVKYLEEIVVDKH